MAIIGGCPWNAGDVATTSVGFEFERSQIVNSSMSNRSFCDTSGMLLAAMVVYVGSLLPAVALGDQQNVRADERAGTTGPPLAVEPFDAATAKGHQEAWAKHLGVPVEMTNSIGMKMVLIPPGEFVMGSPENEEGRLGDEGPQHRVRITKPYYLGMYEVTQGEYERVLDTNPSAFSRNGNRSGRVSGQDTSRFPVERVYGTMRWTSARRFRRCLRSKRRVGFIVCRPRRNPALAVVHVRHLESLESIRP